jgi:hypothetical protein
MSRVALCKDADARREAQRVATPTRKPRNAADAPCRRNPVGAGWICAWASLVPPHLDLPNIVGPASPKRKSTSAAAMWNPQTGS